MTTTTTMTNASVAMRETIQRLFDEAAEAAPHREGDRPALECHILLRGLPTPLPGSLSTTDNGMLKLLSPGTQTHMIEQFFSCDDVLMIVVLRKIDIGPSPILRSS